MVLSTFRCNHILHNLYYTQHAVHKTRTEYQVTSEFIVTPQYSGHKTLILASSPNPDRKYCNPQHNRQSRNCNDRKQHSSEHTEKSTSSSSDFGQLSNQRVYQTRKYNDRPPPPQSNQRVYRTRKYKDHPPPPQSISVPWRSERKLKLQRHSSRSWAKHITCESEPRSSLPLTTELSDWCGTILSRRRQRRRRRESLLVVDSGACKEARQFCEVQCVHGVPEEYSDMEKPSFDRQLPSSDNCDTADLTLKELAGLVLHLCSIRDNQPCHSKV